MIEYRFDYVTSAAEYILTFLVSNSIMSFLHLEHHQHQYTALDHHVCILQDRGSFEIVKLH